MSVKKLHTNYDTFYYITFTCLRWISLFEITGFYDFVYGWFEILRKFNVYNCGYVIMPNHLHMLVYTENSERSINKIIGTGKRFMAYGIVDRLKELGRKDLLQLMLDSVPPSERQKE